MCMTHHDAKRAAAMMEASVIPRMVEAGKLSEVAKMHKEIGDVLRDDDMDAALDHYRRAADMYTSAGSATDALKCNLFVAAELASRMEYDAAIPLFVEVSRPVPGRACARAARRRPSPWSAPVEHPLKPPPPALCSVPRPRRPPRCAWRRS